jgi:hypothetical protein
VAGAAAPPSCGSGDELGAGAVSSDRPESQVAYAAPTVVQLATAVKVAQRWIDGAATGDWDPFLEMLTDDVRFTVPLPGFVPGGVGKAEARRFFTLLTENLSNALTIRNMLANGNRIGFEFRAEGTIQGLPNANHLLLVPGVPRLAGRTARHHRRA